MILKKTNPRILIMGITSIHGWPIFTYLQSLFPTSVLGIRGLYSEFPLVDYPNTMVIEMKDPQALSEAILSFKPDWLIHCFGMCDLDAAEMNPKRAYALNVGVGQTLVKSALMIASAQGRAPKLVYLSYDLVFSGNEPPDMGYPPSFKPDPVSVVGATIAETEEILLEYQNTLVIRLGLPIGRSVQGTKGAYDYIANRIRKQLWMTLFIDEIRSVPETHEIGKAVYRLVEEDVYGIYHLGSVNRMSLYEIGIHIAHELGYHQHRLEPTTTDQAPKIPPRIKNVSLDSTSTFEIIGYCIQGWNGGKND